MDVINCNILLLLLLSRFSRVWLCETRWTAAHQAPQSTGFSRQEYWSGLPFPSLAVLYGRLLITSGSLGPSSIVAPKIREWSQVTWKKIEGKCIPLLIGKTYASFNSKDFYSNNRHVQTLERHQRMFAYLNWRELNWNHDAFVGYLNGSGDVYSLLYINIILSISQDKFLVHFWSQNEGVEGKCEVELYEFSRLHKL